MIAVLAGAALLVLAFGGFLLMRPTIRQPGLSVDTSSETTSGIRLGPPPSQAMADLQTPIVRRFVDSNAKVLVHTSRDIVRIVGERGGGDGADERVVYTAYLSGHLQPWYFYFDDLANPRVLGEVNAWPDGDSSSPERDWTPDEGWHVIADTP